MDRILVVILVLIAGALRSQPTQSVRYEMEKENTDDYFTVVPASDNGALVIRDTDEYRRNEGDIWKIVSLDTDLEVRWEREMAVDTKYILKGYDLMNGHLYLLFREGEFTRSDYHIIRIGVLDGAIERFDVENEVELELSHLTVVGNKLVVGGYVRYSPTLLSYTFGDEQLDVIPGFFKDKSDIVDLRTNENGTFNAVTLEKNYYGYFLRLRTYSNAADILFEREVRMPKGYRILSAKSTGFANGNIAITGSYGSQNSNYAQGVYFAIVKPKGQKNIFRFHSFGELSHFFDYMNPRRAQRMRSKVRQKEKEGKDYKHTARLRLNSVYWNGSSYLISAVVYRPKFDYVNRPGYAYHYGSPYFTGDNFADRVNSRYLRQASRLAHVDEANSFEYYESIVLQLDEKGKRLWDNSFVIDDVETISLEKVVDLTANNSATVMAYLAEDKIRYKTIRQDSVLSEGEADIMLKNETDEIRHTFEGVGSVLHWYGNVFLTWGYHRVNNKSLPAAEQRRNVLYINKLVFD